jgi:Arc/MetJ-type ribon-helix-helix transcriptional regulator
MGEMRRIEVEIDAAMLAAADEAVEHGRFADRDAVIRHALGCWSDEVDRVRGLIDEGFASGDPVEGNFDADDIKRRGRARLAEQLRRA